MSKGIAIAVLLWLAGFAACRLIVPEMLFTPYVAMLDIALVLIIFKGDVRSALAGSLRTLDIFL